MTTGKKLLAAGAIFLIWRELSSQGGGGFQSSSWQTNPGSAVPVWIQQMAQTTSGTTTETSTTVNPFVNPGGAFCP